MSRKCCVECGSYDGHYQGCRTKGYQFISAPKQQDPGDPYAHIGPAPEGLCCGGARSKAGCEYHDPRLTPEGRWGRLKLRPQIGKLTSF